MLNGKVMIIRLITGQIRKTLYKMSQNFSKPDEPFAGDISVKLDLSNYATKADLKGATEVDTSNLAAKSDLTTLKTEADKIDEDKLKIVSVDLSELSNVVIMKLLKRLRMINQSRK